MVSYADDLLNRGGRLLTALARLYATQIMKDPSAERLLRLGGRGAEVDMAQQA